MRAGRAGLLFFSDRYSNLYRRERAGYPDPSDPRELKIIYNIAYGLSASEKERGALLTQYLIKVASKSDVNWDRFLRSDEWSLFPNRSLAQLLLAEPNSLQEKAEASLLSRPDDRRLDELRLELHKRLDDWWVEGDKGKQRRVLELFSQGLITHDEAKSIIAAVPLETIDSFGLTSRVLKAELDAGSVGRHANQASLLSQMARKDVELLGVLAAATTNGQLDPSWAMTFASEEHSSENIIQLAIYLMKRGP